MATFKYRLATLLKLRESARDERRAQLAEAYLAEHKLRERRDAVQGELDEHQDEQQRGVAAGPVDVDRLLGTHRYQLVLRAELAVMDRQNEVLAAEIEKRRQALVVADREVRVLEKLRDTQRERFRQQQELVAMKQLDEVAARTAHGEDDADMRGLIAKLAALVAYFCIATFVAAGAGLAYVRFSGKLDDERVARIVAAVQGAELATAKPKEDGPTKEDNPEQPSFEERDEVRELKARDVEMREQSLKSGLDRVRFEKDKLTEEKDRYVRIKSKFEEELDLLHKGAISSGKESVRLIWENIKPKQAKEQIMQMIAADEMDDVVTIMGAMPIARRAKIIGEFKTPAEVDKLGEVMRLIRQGVPQVDLIENTKDQVKQP